MSESIQQRTGLEVQDLRHRKKRSVFSDDEIETLRNKKIPLGERFRMQSLALGLAMQGALDCEEAAVEEELIQELEDLLAAHEALVAAIGAPAYLTPVEAVQRMREELASKARDRSRDWE